MDGVAAILFQLRLKGVRLWTDNGQLRYQAPIATLSPDDVRTLRALKADIVDYLQMSSPSDMAVPPLIQRLASDCIPLTFAQQWFRNVMHLESHSRRTVYTTTRLSGRLNWKLLQGCVCEVFRRHEALRMRIVTVDGIPHQEVDDCFDCKITVVDLSGMSKDESEREARRHVKRLITEPIELWTGPLFELQLLNFGNDEYVLVTAMDHLMADAASSYVLFKDIWTMYKQSADGTPRSLARLPIQFADYAVWQLRAQRPWARKHSGYWRARLTGAERVRVLADEKSLAVTQNGVVNSEVRFGKILSTELREFTRRERSTLAISLLSVYVSLVFNWCRKRDVVVQFITAGRYQPELENVIGFFSVPLLLRVKLSENDSFLDVLRNVTDEYRRAHEHYDFGRICAEFPHPEFTWNTIFNWLPPEYSVTDPSFLNSFGLKDLRLHPFTVESPYDGADWVIDFPREPVLFLSDGEDGIAGSIICLANRVALGAMQRFERNIRFFAQMFVRHPSSRVAEACCVP